MKIKCKKCNNTFAGGAYLPKTEAGQNIEKMLRANEKIDFSK